MDGHCLHTLHRLRSPVRRHTCCCVLEIEDVMRPFPMEGCQACAGAGASGRGWSREGSCAGATGLFTEIKGGYVLRGFRCRQRASAPVWLHAAEEHSHDFAAPGGVCAGMGLSLPYSEKSVSSPPAFLYSSVPDHQGYAGGWEYFNRGVILAVVGLGVKNMRRVCGYPFCLYEPTGAAYSKMCLVAATSILGWHAPVSGCASMKLWSMSTHPGAHQAS